MYPSLQISSKKWQARVGIVMSWVVAAWCLLAVVLYCEVGKRRWEYGLAGAHWAEQQSTDTKTLRWEKDSSRVLQLCALLYRDMACGTVLVSRSDEHELLRFLNSLVGEIWESELGAAIQAGNIVCGREDWMALCCVTRTQLNLSWDHSDLKYYLTNAMQWGKMVRPMSTSEMYYLGN